METQDTDLERHVHEVSLSERSISEFREEFLCLWADDVDCGVHGSNIVQLDSSILWKMVLKPRKTTHLLSGWTDHEIPTDKQKSTRIHVSI